MVELSLVPAKGKYSSGYTLCSQYEHMSIVYSLIGVTELVDEPTEVVGLAGSPPAEDGCVQMLSSVT